MSKIVIGFITYKAAKIFAVFFALGPLPRPIGDSARS